MYWLLICTYLSQAATLLTKKMALLNGPGLNAVHLDAMLISEVFRNRRTRIHTWDEREDSTTKEYT
jgi:hypothetical protein